MTEDVLDELENIEAEMAKRHLKDFVAKAWSIIEPAVPYVSNWHIEVLCAILEKVSRGELTKVIINIPPGTMKSLLVNVFWPCWEWASNPQLRFLSASYGSTLSIRDNLKVREIIKSVWYQKHFGLQFVGDQDSKVKFVTTQQGWRIATSVNGPGTGEHPDRVVIDDPHSAAQAESEAERKGACNWVDRTISTRGVVRGVRIVIIMQRLHEDDLTGHLLRKGGWYHICFPMRFELPRKRDCPCHNFKADPLDRRKEAGELLWPSLFTEKKVRDLEIELSAYGTAGQLQQRPAPEGGGLFKREWFTVVNEIPTNVTKWCRGWDIAATENGGDWTVGVKIGIMPGPRFVIAHVVRGQYSPHNVDTVMLSTAINDGPLCTQREEKEGGSAGKSVISKRAQLLIGYDYRGVPITGDKTVRANNFRAQCEAGNVLIVAGPWTESYLDELCVYPNGSHDDQIDGSSCSFNELTLGPRGLRIVGVGVG